MWSWWPYGTSVRQTDRSTFEFHECVYVGEGGGGGSCLDWLPLPLHKEGKMATSKALIVPTSS